MTREEIIALASHEAKHCVSIYIPTHEKGHQTKNGYDSLKFKNQLKEAEQELEKQGMTEQERQQFLQKANELVDDGTFWTKQKQGLGIFIAENFFKTVPMSYSPKAHTVVNGRMHVKELIRDMEDADNMYYVLRLSKEHPALFVMNNGEASQIACEDMPSDISEITKYYEVEEELQGRSKTKTTNAFYASAPLDNREKEFILEFFRKIDDSIRPAINTGGSYPPLVLIGDEYMHAIFEEANTYPNLIKGQFTGNVDKHSEKEIADLVHHSISLRFSEEKNRQMQSYKESSNTVSEIADVVEAAYEGRVDTLFVGNGHRFGEFDKENYKVRTNQGNECLYNEAAYHTLKNGGQVVVSDTETIMDTEKEIAAVLRNVN